MFKLLIIQPDGSEVEQDFSGPRVALGRHESCEIRLPHSMVSRTHCVITHEGKRHILKDLSSRNGTWVNGRRIKNRRSMKPGDIIQVGPFRLIFDPPPIKEVGEETFVEIASLPSSSAYKLENDVVVKPLGMISSYLTETANAARKTPTTVRRERLNRNLLTLYRITEELVTRRDLDEMLQYIMDQVFEIFHPSQATILLCDEENCPSPLMQRSAETKRTLRPISNTIVKRVLNDRIAILTDNATEDPRFEMGDSVIIDGIRSVMAAPIWEERSILGLIYVDSLEVVGGYEAEDLDLLTAIGHQTALAVQRGKLTEKLKEEAVKTAVIRQNLSRFHSDQVVDLIMQGVADLEVRETNATIFFCDIVDFTSLCETTDPKSLQKLLNVFCTIVNDAVFQEQGTLDKFIGDAALAIFGAPMHQEDAPTRAIRAALLIRKRLADAFENASSANRFSVRYGINTGQAIVGNFGSQERMDYTILGHAVNLASRICQIAEPDQILIGPETYAAVAHQNVFQLTKAGTRTLKGLKSKMKLHEVKEII